MYLPNKARKAFIIRIIAKYEIKRTKPITDFSSLEIESTFEIELPYSSEKDVRSYNYLSPKRERILIENIILFYKMVFHEEINRLRNLVGFPKKQAVILFMDNYQINDDYYDRVIRSYNRWVEKQSRYKKRKKTKRKSLI